LPYGIKTELRKDSVYNSGNIKMIQNGSKISVTISDYSFDGEFPIYQYDYNGAPHTSIQYTSNIGYFNTSYFQIFVPDKEATIIEDRNYYLTVSDSNFLSTSVSNNVTNNTNKENRPIDDEPPTGAINYIVIASAIATISLVGIVMAKLKNN